MLDFTGVKAITIPEGKAVKITRKSDGVVLWVKPKAFTNLANPKDSYWGEGYRISSSGNNSAAAGATATNHIECVKGDVIRIKGLTLGAYKVAIYYGNKSIFSSSNPVFPQTLSNVWQSEEEKAGVYKFTILYATATSIRFSGVLVGTSNDVIITRNEEIT